MSRWWRTSGIVALALMAFLLASRLPGLGPGPGGKADSLGDDAPAGVRFVTVALGGFRGLLADYLWIRAADLQEKGRFFEVAQMADWITRLEPRYPEVWSYHAWNVAYNITAVVPDPADRWHWVMTGAHLLRDRGIPSNPHAPKLYWDLGWLFHDKVGGRWDEATLFYRVNWAMGMQRLVGQGMLDHARLAAQPAALAAIRQYGLDPEVMQEVDSRYGPLDWRLPESQVVYWGYAGSRLKGEDVRWCERLLWMGLTETAMKGRLAFAFDKHLYLQGPRLDVADKAVAACLSGQAFSDPLSGLAALRFLKTAVLFNHAFGREPEAEAAYRILLKAPGSDEHSRPVAEFAREETSHGEALSAESREDHILNLLAQGELWGRLGNASDAEGYRNLARLYWNALAKDDPRAPAWEELLLRARQQAALQGL